MSKLNILVTGVGSEVGQGIIKALRLSKYKCNIVGSDANPDSAGFFMSDSHYVIPMAASKDYLDKVINICKNNGIKLIFPGTDQELKILSKNRLLFKNINTLLIVQPEKLLDIFSSKYNTYQFLKDNGIPVPETMLIDGKVDIKKVVSRFGFPVILKPDFSNGSKNIYLAHGKEELNLYLQLSKNKQYVVQQYLPDEDEEYTCAVFNCKRLKEPYVIIFKRKLVEGVSGIAEVIFDEDIMSVCRKVAKYSDLEGAINIQLRKFKNIPFIFEINPRYSSTVGIRANCGFNDVQMAVDYFLFGKTPIKPNIHKKKILRYKDEIYINKEAKKNDTSQ